MRRSVKNLIFNQEWIIEITSYERRAYESVDDALEPCLRLNDLNVERKREEKTIHAF